ncbi:unnamed protein product [Discula destructiva]
MAGVAILGVSFVMRAVGNVTGSQDLASAAPAGTMEVADDGIRPSPGCTTNNPVALDSTLNITLGDRRYLVYFPVNYEPDTPAPLVLSYHGGTRTAETQQALDLLSTTYFNEDYITVYPNGNNFTWQGTPNVMTDDIAFTAAILDELEGKYCVDLNRIYATGKSQGGGLVGLLACDQDMSRRIAAFAPVAGAFYQTDFGAVCDADAVEIACNPGRLDVPLLEFHGLADNTIAYGGGPRRGGCLPSIPHFCSVWAGQDDLPSQNRSSSVPGALANSTAVRYEWGYGSKKGLVTHVMSGTDIGHDWPSTEPNSDNLTPGRFPASFNASSMILKFFDKHPL